MAAPALRAIRIEDPEDPRVGVYMNLKDAHLAVLAGEAPADAARGLFMAEGEKVVRAAIRSGYRVASVLATPERAEAMAADLGALGSESPVYVAGRAVIERIVGFDLHRGILAACERGAGRTVGELVESCRVLVVLEDLANHDNVGGIFRNVAALGGGSAGVVLSPRCCDALYRKAIRVSMGHVLSVPFARAERWPDDLGLARMAGFRVVALTTEAGATALADLTPGGPTAILLGAEGCGLTPETAGLADERARIRMSPGVDSLNVGVACAIALHRLADGG